MMQRTKIDLHRHLEGAIRPQTALELGKEAGVFPSDFSLEALCQRAQVLSPMPLLEVLGRFDILREPITNFEAVRRISREAVEAGVREGLTAMNLRFSPMTLAAATGLDVPEACRAIREGIQEADAGMMQIELMAIISRGRGVDKAWAWVRHLEQGEAAYLHGMDFASDEIRVPTSAFTEIAAAINAMGLPLTVHTGEGVGPHAIRETLALPGLQRISHALSLVDDPALLQEVKERDLLVEVSPSSNLRTQLVTSPAQHPAKAMLDAGLKIAICTDDPALFDVDLDYELTLAAQHFEMSAVQQAQSQQWARDALFIAPHAMPLTQTGAMP